jgi:hypothetical protein
MGVVVAAMFYRGLMLGWLVVQLRQAVDIAIGFAAERYIVTSCAIQTHAEHDHFPNLS